MGPLTILGHLHSPSEFALFASEKLQLTPKLVRLGQGRARVISCPQSRRPDARQLRTNALCLRSLNSHAPPSRRITRKARARTFCRVRRACLSISISPTRTKAKRLTSGGGQGSWKSPPAATETQGGVGGAALASCARRLEPPPLLSSRQACAPSRLGSHLAPKFLECDNGSLADSDGASLSVFSGKGRRMRPHCPKSHNADARPAAR